MFFVRILLKPRPALYGRYGISKNSGTARCYVRNPKPYDEFPLLCVPADRRRNHGTSRQPARAGGAVRGEPRTNNECIAGNENASRETAHAAPARDPAWDPFWTRKVTAEYGVRIFLLLLGISIALLAVSRFAYSERAAVAG